MKHYIRINENNHIILGLSDAIKQHRGLILETDICITEEGGRHFELFGEENPSLQDENGIFRFKFDSEVSLRTEEEKQSELDNINKEKQRNQILQELKETDVYLPLETEKMYNILIAEGIISESTLDQYTIERLNRKKELRASLKEV